MSLWILGLFHSSLDALSSELLFPLRSGQRITSARAYSFGLLAAARGLTPSQEVNTSSLHFEGQTVKFLSDSTQIRSLQGTKNSQSSCLVLPIRIRKDN